jgi:argininosuccinate lyase
LPDRVRALELDRPRVRAAISPDMYATDRAVELSQEGLPFRSADRKLAEEPAELAGRTPEQCLSARVSPGAPGDLQLAALRARLIEARAGS